MRYITALAALPFALGAPTLNTRADAAAEAAPGKYIVVLKPDAPAPAAAPATGPGIMSTSAVAAAEKTHIYGVGNFKGFAASLTSVQLAALQADSTVAYIVTDKREAHTMDVSAADQAQWGRITSQANATWGLARISHRDAGTTEYRFAASAGAGTCAYIVDTGVYAEHPEFEGRATFLKNFATTATTDDNGHGTHVSGTIGSKTYGVAKKTKLFGIKVLDEYGYGAWSDIIAGIQYAVEDSKNRTEECPNGYVANMSLGGPRNQALNDVVKEAVEAGIFFAVAAGNEAVNTDASSPSSEPTAFTVGATDYQDQITSFSNYGWLVDGFAPGLDIESTWIGGPTATNIISGTSMASPHMAGLAAYLQGVYGQQDPAALALRIKSMSTVGKVKNIFPNTGTPNLLAFNGAL
ncbi:oryzin precursor [Trichodelitschia bisporula]|uniref:Oryzin n=1 Tax=Trichodelitschia bisporula TaxID=703511 RepID=A0A6G1I8R2_9PEZI|nr:oryzin precursor [Trichodelitschia bisporula]